MKSEHSKEGCVSTPIMQFPNDLNHAFHTLSYLDGGSASMLFQAAVGGLLTGAYYLSTRWRSLKSYVQHIAHRR